MIHYDRTEQTKRYSKILFIYLQRCYTMDLFMQIFKNAIKGMELKFLKDIVIINILYIFVYCVRSLYRLVCRLMNMIFSIF